MTRLPLLLIALSLAATPAAAGTRHDLILARVPVGDLDLASSRGAAAMLQRLTRAAGELCALPPSELLRANPGREWRCRREAVAGAVERLRTPQLALAHSEWLSTDPSAAPPSLRPR